MEQKDLTIIKVLSDLGLRSEPELSPEQEDMLQRALDPELQFIHDVQKLFKKDEENH